MLTRARVWPFKITDPGKYSVLKPSYTVSVLADEKLIVCNKCSRIHQETFQPRAFLSMKFQYSSALTLFSIVVPIFFATAEPSATKSIGMESSNLLLWVDSARECFKTTGSPSVNHVDAECWSKKVRMLLPLLTDKSMTLSTAIKPVENPGPTDAFRHRKFRCTELQFPFNLFI